jgi:hypothetical protein
MQLPGSKLPNRLRHADGVDDHHHGASGGHFNRDLKRNAEHVVRDRLHYDPAHMSDGLLPTILPNWTIKRAVGRLLVAYSVIPVASHHPGPSKNSHARVSMIVP